MFNCLRLLKQREVAATVLIGGPLRYSDQRLAARLDVRDRVRIVGVSRSMQRLYAAVDVTVVPTFHDPAAKVTCESLLLGLPVITTAYDGAAPWVQPAEGRARGHVLADPADSEALSRAMTDLADPARRRQYTAAMGGLADELAISRHLDALEALLAGAR